MPIADSFQLKTNVLICIPPTPDQLPCLLTLNIMLPDLERSKVVLGVLGCGLHCV